jgi:hypothetical protein
MSNEPARHASGKGSSSTAAAKRKAERDAELDPTVMYVEVPEDHYKAEIEVLDRFLAFAAELLRMALLGVAVFGFLYTSTVHNFRSQDLAVRILAGVGVLLFGLSAGLAILYRYAVSDAFHAFTMGLRLQRAGTTESHPSPTRFLEVRLDERLRQTGWSKKWSAICLVLGSIVTAAAFAAMAIWPGPLPVPDPGTGT